MPAPLTLVGLAGSLRAASLNRALLHAAAELAPDGLAIEPFPLGDVPLYNGDLDTDDARPEAVDRLRAALAAADGVLIATPEYNHSVPGVLQNALDWASRPHLRSPMAGLPAGILGASPSAVGTARAQEVLKNVLHSMGTLVMPHGGVLLGRAHHRVENGRLADEGARAFLEGYLIELADWTRRHTPQTA